MKSTKIIKLVISISIFFLIMSYALCNKNIIFAMDEDFVSEKIYAEVNTDDAFDETCVLVILDKSVSGINKTHNNTIFRNIEYKNITDLTYVNDVDALNDIDSFEQILKIDLLETGKEKVIEMIELLSEIPGIKYVGPDWQLQADRVANDPLYAGSGNLVDNQWAHQKIESEKAWDFTVGSDAIRVGVIDDGVNYHSDLLENVVEGYDFVNMSDNVPGSLREVEDSHGTHIAGIIGADSNQINPLGVTGVNWKIQIVPLQVDSDSDYLFLSACVSAVTYATGLWNQENRISILNMSIGNDKEWPYMESAIRQFKGLFICATGNEGYDIDLPMQHRYPAYYGSSLYENPLENMIAVGRTDINDQIPIDNYANWGEKSISIYAPGEYILSTFTASTCENYHYTFSDGTRMCEFSTEFRNECLEKIENGEFTLGELLDNFTNYFRYPPKKYATTTHHSNGYHYCSGSSMSAPYVAGVAALLLSLNKDLSTSQLKQAILQSADEINVRVKNEEINITEFKTVLRLNAYKAVKYVLQNYMNPTTYTLSNYSNTVNTNKEITSNSSYFNELNGFYKLNVEYAKNYEFIISSSNQLDVILYDENLTEISFNNLNSSTNKVRFIQNLSVGTYYLRTKLHNENLSGTINTEIISRNTVYLSPGINNILANTYNNISEYYVSVTESGFYELKIIGNTSNGNSITYPNECIKLYEDNDHEIYTDKYQLDDYTYNAISIGNRLFVYLSSNKYYYLKLELSDLEYSSLSLSIAKEETLEYDFSNNLAFGMFEELFNANQVDDYLKKISISHRSLFTLDALTFNEVSSNIKVLILKEEYNPNLKQTYLEETFIYEITPNNSSPEFNFILEAGTYYFGYIENISSVTIKYVLERIIDTSVDIYNTLVADPNYIGYDLGSEVRYNNGLCDNYTITEGFTRNMYVMVEDRNTQSISRLDYDWYSSNDDIAIVTSYGTVLAKNVDTNIEVKIYAMLKEDPSIVYEKTFTIINDESVTPIEITSNMSYSYSELNGEYKLELNTNNSIFPYIQYYTWEIEENELNINMDNWGFISSNGTGTVVIIGSYIYNPRVTIIINLTILE